MGKQLIRDQSNENPLNQFNCTDSDDNFVPSVNSYQNYEILATESDGNESGSDEVAIDQNQVCFFSVDRRLKK